MSRRLDVSPEHGTTLGLTVFEAAVGDDRAVDDKHPASNDLASGDFPVALILPAMGVRAAYYERFAETLAACGVQAATADWRGHGMSRPHVSRRSRFGYAELVERDIPTVIESVQAEFGGRPVCLIGHSLGAQLSAVALGTGHAEARGLVILAAGSAHHAYYPQSMSRRLRRAARTSPVVTALVGYWPGERMGFAGRESRGVMRDWSRQVLTGRYEFGGRDHTPDMAAVRLPVLAVSIGGDTYAPTTATEGLLALMPHADVERWTYTEADAGRPIDHFRWTRASEALAKKIVTWLPR